MPTTTLNSKGTVTFKTVSPNLQFAAKTAAGSVTLKHKTGDVTTSLQFSDATARDVNSLKDVVLTFDYRYSPALLFTGAYDFDSSKHKVSGTWTGHIADRHTSAKVTYNEKNSSVASEVKYSFADNVVGTVNLDLDKPSVTSAKALWRRGGLAWEPSWNFVSQSPSFSVTKKHKGTSTKLQYDLKSEKASLEWSKTPFKVSVHTTVSKTLQPTKPNVSIVYEKLYHL
jgi:hypothetical protein